METLKVSTFRGVILTLHQAAPFIDLPEQPAVGVKLAIHAHSDVLSPTQYTQYVGE